MSATSDEIENLRKDHWNNLLKIKEKSEDDFDKNITAIAAGTLAITLTFHQIIVKADETSAHWLLFASWVSLGILMIFNLISNYISILQVQTTLNELSDDELMDNDANMYNIKVMNIMNFVKIALLFIGLSFFLTYVIINMNKKDDLGSERNKPTIGTRSLVPIPKKLRKNPPVQETEKSKQQMDSNSVTKEEN